MTRKPANHARVEAGREALPPNRETGNNGAELPASKAQMTNLAALAVEHACNRRVIAMLLLFTIRGHLLEELSDGWQIDREIRRKLIPMLPARPNVNPRSLPIERANL